MNLCQETLRRTDGALEALHDLSEGIADLGFFLELGLEAAEDGGVEEAGLVGHCGLSVNVKLWLMVLSREFLEVMIIGERWAPPDAGGDLATWYENVTR